MPEIVTPDLTGQANKYLKVNAGETGYEFGTPGGGPGAVNWGDVGGTLSDQTDLQTALNGKANSLGADENYVTDAQLVVIGNTSGTNTGDNATNAQYSGLAASKQDADAQLTSLAGLSYTGNSLKVVRVNAGETDFELAAISAGGLEQYQVRRIIRR